MLKLISTGGETRTPSQRFWRPLLYQLSYTRVWNANRQNARGHSPVLYSVLIQNFNNLSRSDGTSALTYGEP